MRAYKKETLYPYTQRLSGSQLLDYAKDPSRFFERWGGRINGEMMEGVDKEPSKAMIFGTGFQEAYCDRSFDYVSYFQEHKINRRLIELTSRVLALFPVIPTKCCEVELLVKHRGWEIRVTLDGLLKEQGCIIENKTGELMWTQDVCDDHDQLTLQQWAYWRKFKKLPKSHLVNWVDTSTRATKPIHTFKTKRTITQLKAFEKHFIDVILDGLEVGNFTTKPPIWRT